jgi:hypothetical protein
VELALCGAARAVSIASCQSCTITHIQQLAAAKCTDSAITQFCNHSASPCVAAETKLCGSVRASGGQTGCTACAAAHLLELSAAHCTSDDIDSFCKGGSPPPPSPPSPPSPPAPAPGGGGTVGGYVLLGDNITELSALADAAETLPVTRVLLAFLRPSMVYEAGSHTLNHTGWDHLSFDAVKAAIAKLTAGGVEVFLSIGVSHACAPIVHPTFARATVRGHCSS